MNKTMYAKLAVNNIKKNGKNYIPYILTCIVTIAMFYIIFSLSRNSGLENVRGGSVIEWTLTLGTWITGIFSVIFLFYTNSFLIKQRKKELGLYNILGMEKRHISKVIFYETVYTGVFCIATGLFLGILLDKLMFLLLLKVFQEKAALGFYISRPALLVTFILFVLIFIAMYVDNLRQIYFFNPIELLKGGEVGEREPKTKKIQACLGVLCLGAGYYIAVNTQNPVKAVSVFFIAVVLVIVGTYFLFTAGSIAALKMLRKNKAYYYQTKHFISISGMIYRMKQNAAGLSNICILSTMVLVMVSTTLSMYIGMEDALSNMHKKEMAIVTKYTSHNSREVIKKIAKETVENQKFTIKNEYYETFLEFVALKKGNEFQGGIKQVDSNLKDMYGMTFVTLEDYNRIADTNYTLQENQVLFYVEDIIYLENEVKIMDSVFQIKEKLDSYHEERSTEEILPSCYIVVRDVEIMKKIYLNKKKLYGDKSSEVNIYYGFDVDTSEKNMLKLYEDITGNIKEYDNEAVVECRSAEKDYYLSTVGGLFFIGVFLGILFIMATVLMIYYKQISEGYDDRGRFQIMEKVGMSHEEIKKSIGSQVITVFFLPLITAGIHVIFAFPFITKILLLVYLNNVPLFAWCTVGCFLVFGLFYGIVYGITARVYYKIVS